MAAKDLRVMRTWDGSPTTEASAHNSGLPRQSAVRPKSHEPELLAPNDLISARAWATGGGRGEALASSSRLGCRDFPAGELASFVLSVVIVWAVLGPVGVLVALCLFPLFLALAPWYALLAWGNPIPLVLGYELGLAGTWLIMLGIRARQPNVPAPLRPLYQP
jgi:hypothetical protein